MCILFVCVVVSVWRWLLKMELTSAKRSASGPAESEKRSGELFYILFYYVMVDKSYKSSDKFDFGKLSWIIFFP